MLFLSGLMFETGARAEKFFGLLMLSCCLCLQLIRAQEADVTRQRAYEILEKKGELVFEFFTEDPSLVKQINSFLSVDRKTADGYEAYASLAGFRKFLEMGIPYQLIERSPVKKSLSTEFPGNWDTYPTHEQYGRFMLGIGQAYPGICRLDTLGQSVNGRDILAMKITDRPDLREPEPAFVYSSTMHGHETAGHVILLRLIKSLCSGYGEDTLITRLVDNIEIWINPLANPDGYPDKRFNANNIDLNRNFPGLMVPWPDYPPIQPENLAQMEFLDRIYMVMGANIHGGEEVINYPFDAREFLHADDAWYRRTSREYTRQARERSFPVLYMSGFDEGVTNGWQWYSIEGSRMDWVNYHNHGREVTLEVSRQKSPPAEDLPLYWHWNHPSLLRYMEQSLFGIHGMVRDRDSGSPVRASLCIPGHDAYNSSIRSDSITGYFARPIEPGTWDLEITAEGYEPAVIDGVLVRPEDAVWLDIRLSSLAGKPAGGSMLSANPNPFFHRTRLYIPVGVPGTYRILIYDIQGKIVHQELILCRGSGIHVHSLDGSSLVPGIYLLKLISPVDARTLKIFRSQ